jgi:hypothetical protein
MKLIVPEYLAEESSKEAAMHALHKPDFSARLMERFRTKVSLFSFYI